MLKKIASIILGLLLCPVVYAQDELFLSLTRKAESVNDLPTNISLVTGTHIQESGARNAGEALTNVTGLTSGVYGSLGAASNIMLRGSSAEQVLVLIDGRRINDPAMGLVDLSTIPTENIERIEIIRGGVSALYGTSAFGGIVNIITKKTQDAIPTLDLGLSAGSFNTQRYALNFGVKNDRTSGFFSAGKIASDGWRDNSQYDNNNVFVRLGCDALDWGNFDISASNFASTAGVPGMGVDLSRYNGSLEKQASTPTATQKENDSFIRLEHTKKLGAHTLKTILYTSENRTDYTVPTWLLNDRYQSTVFGTEVQLATGFGLTAGTEWTQEMSQNIDKNLDVKRIDTDRITTAGYLQQEITYKKLELIPSARLDDNSVFGTVASPRMTVLFHASSALKVSANTGKAWRAPTINELYWPTYTDVFFGTTYITKGNPLLQPEDGITSDIGVEYHTPDWRTSLTYFVTESNNLISWQESSNPATNTITTIPRNIGKSRQQGVEFEYGRKIISGLSHKLNYTCLWAEDTEQHVQLNYRPQNTVNYEISYMPFVPTKVTVVAHYVSAQKTGNAAVPELKEYTVVNCRVSQKLKTIELWAGIDDIFDVLYQTRLYYPIPGQTISAGINWKFQG